MQNEITELRNQVRTLKRIVYGFGCLLVAGVVVSATSVQTNTIPTEFTVKHELTTWAGVPLPFKLSVDNSDVQMPFKLDISE